MNEENISIFKNSGTDVELPKTSEADNEVVASEALKSGDTVKTISGDVVKRVILDEVEGMEVPNYVLDFRYIKEPIYTGQLHGIKGLVSDDNGDVPVYVIQNDGIYKIGCGEAYRLDRLLALSAMTAVSKDVVIYKDFINAEYNTVLTFGTMNGKRMKI